MLVTGDNRRRLPTPGNVAFGMTRDISSPFDSNGTVKERSIRGRPQQAVTLNHWRV